MKNNLIIISTIMFLNWILIAIYCRIERFIDERKFKRESTMSVQSNLNDNEEEISVVKQLYYWGNSYFYGWVRFNVLVLGYFPSYRIRKIFYRAVFGMKLTRKTVIFGKCEFRSPWNISIGNSTISANCILDGRGKIDIGNDVVLGSGVHIWTEEHSINDPYFRVLKENIQPVIIKGHAWVCSDTTILPGITIKEGAVLASRACAVKDCEAYKIYGGIPAKIIGERNRDLRYELSGKVSWHFM